jgi:hypothetical protein
MKKIFLLLFLIASPLLANDDFKQVGFLEGCWKGSMEGSTVYESWGNADGKMMLGTSKTVSKGAIESFEFLSIVPVEGKLQYVPYVNGTKSVSFAVGESSAKVAQFSNPSHDFPKVIRYELNGNKLTVRLSGDGPNISYELDRISCTVR